MKSTILSIVIAVVIIGGAYYLSKGGAHIDTAQGNNVSIVNGRQIIEISAKGGYLPRKSIAQAGIPTILKIDTNGTFDCSSVLRIPSMNITKNLPPSGETEIDLGNPKVATLQATCGMGMYSFEVDFQG